MALIELVKNICDRLADKGWGELIERHGLNISQPSTEALAKELNKTISVDRTISGFEDFSVDTVKGIEPENPADSLFYHALASTNVSIVPVQGALQAFPTLKDLDDVESK